MGRRSSITPERTTAEMAAWGGKRIRAGKRPAKSPQPSLQVIYHCDAVISKPCSHKGTHPIKEGEDHEYPPPAEVPGMIIAVTSALIPKKMLLSLGMHLAVHISGVGRRSGGHGDLS